MINLEMFLMTSRISRTSSRNISITHIYAITERVLRICLTLFIFSRFLTRIAQHPRLRMDPDFREFLEYESDLPRSTSTHALSGANVMKLFKNVGDAVGKITFRMEEPDEVSLQGFHLHL